jgi:phytoene desaturase
MLDLQRVDPTYHLVFDDGSQLALTSDLKSMSEQLEAIEPGSFNGFLRYLDEGDRHYQLAMDRLVTRDFRTAAEFFNLSNLSLIREIKPFTNHYRNMAGYFNAPRLKSAFTFQDVYMGLSPFEAPATFSMMSYTELAHGVWYPRGGMYRVVEALVHLAREAGVEFAFEAPVERIETAGSQVCGVRLDGDQRLKAEIVVANADLPYVYGNLLPEDGLAGRLYRKRYSCSVISFFWCVDRPYESLSPHTLFLADDFRENFDSIIAGLALPHNPSLYVHAPARLDPTMAPPGKDTLIAVVPVGHMADDQDAQSNGKQDWGKIKEQARQAVFRRLALLGINDLERHVESEVCYIPPSWQKRYNLVKGSTHGLCHNLTQLAYFRPANRHPRYPNLYFVGASTRPGTGVPTALVSGRLAATRIMDELE